MDRPRNKFNTEKELSKNLFDFIMCENRENELEDHLCEEFSVAFRVAMIKNCQVMKFLLKK